MKHVQHYPSSALRTRPAICRSALLLALFSLPLPAINAQQQGSQPNSETPVQLSAFHVSSTGDRGYGVGNSLGASRINLPIGSVSHSIATLNTEFLQDIAAGNMVEAIKYVANIDTTAPSGHQWVIRGVENGIEAVMLDGLPDPVGGRNWGDPFLVDRIEVVKGPVGTLYGAHPAGGVINRVSKMPLANFKTELSATVGSWEMKRFQFDTTGPAKADRTLRYRLIGMVKDGSYFAGGTNDSHAIAPSVSLDVGSASSVWVRYLYRYEKRPGASNQNWFLDAGKNVSYFIPRDFRLDNSDTTFEDHFRGYELGFQSRFQSGLGTWNLRFVTRYNDSDFYNILYLKSAFRFVDEAGALVGTQANTLFSNPRWRDIIVTRSRREREEYKKGYVSNIDLAADLKTGPFVHRGLTYLQTGGARAAVQELVMPYTATSLRNPVNFAQGRSGATGPTSVNTDTESENSTFAWGIHDNIFAFDERLVLAAGARYDHQRTNGLNKRTQTSTKAGNRQWSKKVGIVVTPIRGASIFVNHSETFVPENRVDVETGQKFPNQLSDVIEMGVKAQLFNSRIIGTVSAFDQRDNDVVVNVHDPITGRQSLKPIGDRVVQGWDADIDLQLIDPVIVKLAVGSIDRAETAEGLRARWVGLGLNYRAFAKYTVKQGLLKGFSIGGGMVHKNRSAADNTDTFQLPGVHTFDGFLQYERGRSSIQFNMYNLTDKIYAPSAVDSTRIYSGEPRNLRVTWRYRL